jgi:hypothetical protein
LDYEIQKTLSKQSFQAPSNVENALLLISVKNIWFKVSQDINIPKEDIITQLGLIVNRRNKIAHEADFDSITRAKLPMNNLEVKETIDFIQKIVTSIENNK